MVGLKGGRRPSQPFFLLRDQWILTNHMQYEFQEEIVEEYNKKQLGVVCICRVNECIGTFIYPPLLLLFIPMHLYEPGSEDASEAPGIFLELNHLYIFHLGNKPKEKYKGTIGHNLYIPP